MGNPLLATGSVWRLHSGDREVARLVVTGADWPWMHADVEALPGFEEFRALFEEQQRAQDEEDWERAEACYARIRAALTMTFPDGSPVAEFLLNLNLNLHGDSTAAWRWHNEPFDGPSHT